MTEALSHLDQVLEWVYDQSGGTSSTSVAIGDYAQSIGLDLDDAFTIVWTCRDAGLGQDTSGTGNPCIRISPAGLARIYSMKIRRDDPALAGALSYAAIAATTTGDIAPDWTLGLASGLGGLIGGYLGACLQPRIPERALRLLLGTLATALATLYLTQAATN